MKQGDLETLYEALALAVDAVGEEKSELFLAKVALALGHALGDIAAATAIVERCTADLADPLA